jgi:hypothetical protein
LVWNEPAEGLLDVEEGKKKNVEHTTVQKYEGMES